MDARYTRIYDEGLCVYTCTFVVVRARSQLLYTQDPNDSTTFPGYQAPQHAPEVAAQHPLSPYDGNANTLANMQMSRVQGYSGLPTV